MFGKRAALAALAVIVSSVPAHAAVTISTAATKNMTCSGDVCSPTAENAVLNVSDLENLLESGNLTVTTTGRGVQANDIRAKTRLSWQSAATLTLDAYRSVGIEYRVSVEGGGGVTIITNDGGTDGTLSFTGKGRTTFHNLASSLVINGESYTLVGDVNTLAAAIAAHPNGDFALANSYDAKADGTYTTTPVPTKFVGKLEGLGNTLSHVTINDTSSYDVGFFGETDTPSIIENIVFAHLDVSGSTIFEVGGMVALGLGTIRHASVEGKISGARAETGCLVGINAGLITFSSGHCDVSGAYAGGLAGDNGGTISDSYANGSESGGAMGGLAGVDDGLIEDSHATAAVAGGQGDDIGGLVGTVFGGTITRSYATGAVTGGDGSFAGGITGYIDGGTVDQSFSTGAVLVGRNGAVGGLVAGMCSCEFVATVTNSYSLGSSKGKSGSTVGGLAGFIQDSEGSTITAGYSTGIVSRHGNTGGFIGYDDNPGDIASAYWDTTTSGITNPAHGAGNVKNDPGITALTDAQLKSGLPQGFDPNVWASDTNINNGYPYLINNPPP